MHIQAAIKAVTERKNLTSEEMVAVMQAVMTGETTDAQMAGFLIGLRMKGETVDEIAAAAKVMRNLATPVAVSADHLVDTCGTGGDASGSFNISTASAIVSAAAGAKVAKHGNRSITSKSGSADVLEAAGVNLNCNAEQVAACVRQVGVGFMFAPAHHSAMKHAIGPRKEMGVRTLFNVLGPLTNPAAAPNQVMGVFDDCWLEPLAQVLKKLGSRHVMMVHAEDGMDEISIASATNVVELKNGEINAYQIQPEQFALQRADLSALAVEGPEQSLRVIHQVFDNQAGPARDIVCLNAGAAIYVAGLVDDLPAGIDKAAATIASGQAKSTLQALINFTQQCA